LNFLREKIRRLARYIAPLVIIITVVVFGAAAIPIDQGPGGPVLIVTSSANAFSKYYAEILRAEGLNAFTVIDVSQLSAATLSAYDVVLLGQVSLTTDQVTVVSNYVSSGGNLIAMRPDNKLAGVLGLTATGGTLSDKYLLIDNSTSVGIGLVNSTIQFHGAGRSLLPQRSIGSGDTVFGCQHTDCVSSRYLAWVLKRPSGRVHIRPR
jgi:hypothetical protein